MKHWRLPEVPAAQKLDLQLDILQLSPVTARPPNRNLTSCCLARDWKLFGRMCIISNWCIVL
jgi:hypothetical protein